MTKQPLHEDALKNPLGIDDCKIEVAPKTIDNTMVIGGTEIIHKPKAKVKARITKPKSQVKRTSRIGKATACLFDLADAHGPEKPLNIEFGLYQMEDY